MNDKNINKEIVNKTTIEERYLENLKKKFPRSRYKLEPQKLQDIQEITK